MQSIRIQTSQNIELEYQLAGIGDRMLAFLVDLAIYIAYWFLIYFANNALQFITSGTVVFLLMLPVTFYNILTETFMNGQTVGKKVTGIQVVSLDGGQASFGQYLTRALFGLLDIYGTSGIVAVVLISLSEKSQRLGDKVAGTVVVRTNQKTTIHDTIFVETAELYQPMYPTVVELTERDISLVKEVLNRNLKLPNYEMLMRTANKIKTVLQLDSTHEAQDFLYTILKDYNHLTSK